MVRRMAHLPTNNQTVEAVDVRSKKTVTLVLTNQTWFSNGVFSNIYRGKLVQPQEREVAIKRPGPTDRAAAFSAPHSFQAAAGGRTV